MVQHYYFLVIHCFYLFHLFEVDVDELTAILTNLESSFPNNPSVSIESRE